MNTFKTYFRIVRARPLSFLLPLVIFTAMIFLFTAATRDADMDQIMINYAYLIEGEKPAGWDELVAHLEKGGHVYEYRDEDAMRMGVFDEVADFAFVVKDGTFIALPQGLAEHRFAAMQRIQQYIGYRALYEKYDIPEAEEKLAALMKRETKIETPVVNGERPLLLLRQYYNFASYVTIVGLFNIMIVVSTVFNKKEFLQRNRISKTPYDALQRGIMAGHLVIMAAVFLLIAGGSVVLHGPEAVFSPAGQKMTLGFGLYTLCIALLGFFLTRIVNNLQIGTMITNLVALGMSFISGAFVPARWLSEPVIKASRVFPMYWFLRGNELALEGSAGYWKGLLVIGLMCAVLLLLIFVADFRKTRTAVA